MARDVKSFVLYWSNLQRYEDCPQGFLWNRGWPTVDLGNGLGRKKSKPFKKTEHHAVMGIVIQAVIERFYNDELWKVLTPLQLQDRLMELMDEHYRLELSSHFIDWNKTTHEEMKETIRKGIKGYMRTLKQNKLIGPYAHAEADLVGYVNKWTPIGGRADLLIRRDDTGITIIDGKNSRRYKDRTKKGGWMTFTDPDQLRWYALCFYLSYRRLPDRIGFVYYRYPSGDTVLDTDGNPVLDEQGAETKEDGVVWVPFTMDDIKGLGQRANDALLGMKREKFKATPTPKTCRFCDYESECPERQAQKQANRRKPRGVDAKIDGIGAGGGFHDFSFGDE